MKAYTYFIVFFTAVFILGCESPVVFSHPQPEGEPNLSIIPSEYRGIYWCDTDSIALTINETMIFKAKKYETKLSISEIESTSNISFRNNTLYSKELNDSFPAKQIGDTVIAQITLKDTLFSSGSRELLKKFKGHLILNQPLEKELWEVTIVSLKQSDLLSMRKAQIPDNLEELERITKVKKYSDDTSEKTIKIKIAPTRAEFDQILNQGLLFDGSCLEFKRIFPVTEIPL